MKTIEISRKVLLIKPGDVHLHPQYGNLILLRTIVADDSYYRLLTFQSEDGRYHSWELHVDDRLTIKEMEVWRGKQ